MACTDMSSAETGSSQMISLGSSAKARAIAMRCRCPPLNSSGSRRAASAGNPTASRSASTLRPTSDAVPPAIDAEGLRNDLADRQPRVERRVRILEDHLYVGPEAPQRLPAQPVIS